MKPTCLILGIDGFDIDVLLNTVKLYTQLGFRVVYSRKIVECNILVILRANNQPLSIAGANPTQIHVYQYTGFEIYELIKSLCNFRIILISPNPNNAYSKFSKDTQLDYLDCPPPVYPEIWMVKPDLIKEHKYPLTHIGHFKPFLEDTQDIFGRSFLETLKSLEVHIWGKNWEGYISDKRFLHGKANVNNVSKIYSQSAAAIGIMYPFQRDNTFSGRFWHGPLNGCTIFSEPSAFSRVMPGVVECDLLPTSIEKIIKVGLVDRASLQMQSAEFWRNTTKKLEKHLTILINQDKSRFTHNSSTNFSIFILKLDNIFRNIARRYYQ